MPSQEALKKISVKILDTTNMMTLLTKGWLHGVPSTPVFVEVDGIYRVITSISPEKVITDATPTQETTRKIMVIHVD